MPPLNPELLPVGRALAAALIFLGSYVVFAFGKFPGMKIDRPGAAIIGAVLMVAFRIVGTREALASVDLGTIVLVFSMMVIVANLRLAGFFDWLVEAILRRLHPRHLLPVVVFTCGCMSAFLVNDVVCVVMTPFVLRVARRLGLPPVPYLLAVALASNVGSVATITGNPQNMLIGSLSGLSYLRFLAALVPVAFGGLVLTWAIIHWLCLPGRADEAPVADTVAAGVRARVRVKPVVVLAVVFVGFVTGVPVALMAAIGAALLLVTRTVEPREVYEGIDWGLLVFFVGLFIIVGGAERAGLVETLLRPFETWNLHRLVTFVPITVALSNIVSNVPAVMLLRTLVGSFPDPHAGWLVLAMASTLAGNLTLTGSVANIIVVEGAARGGVSVRFGDYARVGIPVTVATVAFGTLWLWILN